MKKGVHNIFSSFFFSFILVIAALGMVQYGEFILKFKVMSGDQAQDYALVESIKNRIQHCYGDGMVEFSSMEYECMNFNVFNGYKIQIEDWNNPACGNYSYLGGIAEGEALVYYIPVVALDNNTVCPAKLFIYMKNGDV